MIRHLLPLTLIVLAAAAAGVVAYGCDPAWAQYSHGMGLIQWTRRFQWLLVAMALLASLGVIAAVAVGKSRIWWLLGLGPVLALFLNRGGPAGEMAVLDGPKFVEIPAATLRDDEYVVGLVFAEKSFAYPYAALRYTPVVVQSEHDKRMLLLWSPMANRAVAWNVKPEIRGRDLDIASMPAGALLVYNARRGQFINGVTGLTTKGEPPAGIRGPLPTWKMTWAQWRDLHPKTQVMVPALTKEVAEATGPVPPPAPVLRGKSVADGAKRVMLVPTTKPAVLTDEQVGSGLVNFISGQTAILILRDPHSGQVCAFDSLIAPDLPATFTVNTDRTHHGRLMDKETHSGWDVVATKGAWPLEIKAVDGPCKDQHKVLGHIPVETDLAWGVLKLWREELTISDLPKAPEGPALRLDTPPAPPVAPAPPRRPGRGGG